MGKFQKGQSGNPNGRPKGSRNKSTEEIKRILNDFVAGNLDDLQKEYDKMKPEKKLQFMERILRFVIPSQEKTETTISNLPYLEYSEEDLKAIEQTLYSNSED